MASTHTASLEGLTPREAIHDALARAETAFDYNYKALYETAVSDDFQFEMVGGGPKMDKEKLWAWIIAKVSGAASYIPLLLLSRRQGGTQR